MEYSVIIGSDLTEDESSMRRKIPFLSPIIKGRETLKGNACETVEETVTKISNNLGENVIYWENNFTCYLHKFTGEKKRPKI